MAGGAAVMGILKAVAHLKLNCHIVGIVPTAENLPSGTAYRPGDVIWMGSGKSVEILNTDAEGRLLLGDALFYAQRYKPKVVIDLATLTGACVVALGYLAIGLLGNDSKFVQKIKEAGDVSGEKVWELPLWDEYFDQIRSDVAEIKNVGGKGAGTITAAMFLKQFVNFPWAHLDIAGTAWAEEKKPYCPKGATGVGVRLLTKMLRNWKK
jgi:leucyl aminopeptidase